MAFRALLPFVTMRPAAVAGNMAFRRTFLQGRVLGLKESESANPNPGEFEKHKIDSLEKQKRGDGHWKPELASVSEESVKADRHGPKVADEASMKRLQEDTKGSAEETLKAGTSMKDHHA